MKLETQNLKHGKTVALVVVGLALAVCATGCPRRSAPADACADACGGHEEKIASPASGVQSPQATPPADACADACGTAKPAVSAVDAHGHSTGAKVVPTESWPQAPAKDSHGHEAAAPAKDAHGHAAAPAKAGAGAGHAGEKAAPAGDGCEDEVVLTAAAITANGVVVEAVAARELSARFTLPGRLAFDTEKTAHIGTPVAGRVAKILVQPGDAVKKGDALLVIESVAAGEAQSNYLQKRMSVKTAEGALALAAAAAARGGKLKESGALANAEIAKRDTEQAAAENALQAAQAEQQAAENTLRLLGFDAAALKALAQTGEISTAYTVRAPVDGVVVEREVTPGEVVGPEREALARLADTKALWVLADAPENRLAEVAVGAAAEVMVDALGGKLFAGRVTYVAPALNEATRTALVRVVLDDAESARVLRAGMFARVAVSVPVPGGAVLAVPEGAVLTVEGGPAVFVAVAGEPGAFQKRAIVPGAAAAGWIPVVSGLKAGEKVVTGGTFILKAELAKGIMEGKTCTGH